MTPTRFLIDPQRMLALLPKCRISSLLGCLLFCIVASAQQLPSSETPSPTIPAANGATDPTPVGTDHRYRIGPNDVLDIRVFNRSQLSRDNVRVDESGVIVMPLIGDVKAACRTEKELAREITNRYLAYQRNPQVDVFIKDYQSQAIAVIGAVRSPGRFQLHRPVRLIEILSFVGGPSEKAGREVQIIRVSQAPGCEADDRSTETDPEENVVTYDLKQTLQGDDKANPYLQPGDIVSLLEADQVYVVGNVLRPSPISLAEPLTVSQAIAIAGGTMPDTKSDKVRIVRRVNGVRTELFVNLAAIDKRQAEDLELHANDVIDVPTSTGKRFLRSLLGVVAPTVGALPVRVIH